MIRRAIAGGGGASPGPPASTRSATPCTASSSRIDPTHTGLAPAAVPLVENPVSGAVEPSAGQYRSLRLTATVEVGELHTGQAEDDSSSIPITSGEGSVVTS